ncbi:sensor protein [Salinarchaeum sp. Harcht-Bsk1]|uniref:DICT sensory domain-containing protein n=1 Tax=Salinarchaeum sp. Harcht-Bsk1 TaxID=1333523 RepID=UPI0003423FFE|nr:DICT sensory domain-containing protein [Salinarchaeum sp. Harcht-Bsk1]AGN00435.1 sensor protein [Salinarchaeum sp. Harcht-Bsk1]
MTTLDSLLERVRDRHHHFTVYRGDEETDLPDRFATHAVNVDVERLPSGGPGPFVVIEADGEFVGAIGERELDWLLEPPIARPGESPGVSEGYRVLFDVLDETVFRALSRRQLLAVSREIEDRAYRVGIGTLAVGFQTLSNFESQADLYRELATATALDVHVFGAPDWAPPDIPGITYHRNSGQAQERHWVLGFEGGLDQLQACGLVAQEQTDYYEGFWTDDEGLVDEILTALGVHGTPT